MASFVLLITRPDGTGCCLNHRWNSKIHSFPTSFWQLVITVIAHFGHAVFHIFQWISVPGAAPTNNLRQKKNNPKNRNEKNMSFKMVLAKDTICGILPDRYMPVQESTWRDSLVHSHGSGVYEEWGWNLRCSSCTSSPVRLEQVLALSLLATDAGDLWPGRSTHRNLQWPWPLTPEI